MKKTALNIASGIIVGFVATIFALALAIMIFSGPLTPYRQTGIVLSLIGLFCLSLIIALFGKGPKGIGMIQDSLAVFMSITLLGLTTELANLHLNDLIFPTAIAVLMISALLTGIFFLLLGFFKGGMLVRFIPFSVTGGFMAGAGFLLVQAGITLLTPSIADHMDSDAALQIVLAISVGFFYFFSTRLFNQPLAFPIAIALSLLLFYLCYALMPYPFQGWLLGPFTEGNVIWPPIGHNYELIHWQMIGQYIWSILALVLLGTVGMLLNLISIEILIKDKFLLDYELMITGMANIITGSLGGFHGYHSSEFSTVGYSMKTNNRINGLMAAAFALFFLLIGVELFGWFPKFILSGFLIYLGIRFLNTWVIEGIRKLPIYEYAIVIIILVTMILTHFVVGIAVGILISAILFIINYSHIDIVKNKLLGNTFHSNVLRMSSEIDLLEQHGSQILILQLQGYLFFGIVDSLIHEIQTSLKSRNREVKFLIFDFSLVTGIDSSTILAFKKILTKTKNQEIYLLFSALTDPMIHKIKHLELPLAKKTGRSFDVIQLFNTLDLALEWCEELILNEHATGEKRSFEISQLIKTENKEWIKFLDKKEYSAGEPIIKQGSNAEELFFIESGKVNVIHEANGKANRISNLGPGSIIGELSFYLKQPRSSSVIAETDATIYSLSPMAIKKMDPKSALAIHSVILTLLSQRILLANRTIVELLK